MTASDKKKTVVLVLLLGGVVASWYNFYRPSTAVGVNATTKAAAKAKPPKVKQEAQIRTDMINKPTSVNVGKKNLFAYGQKPAPPKPAAGPPAAQQVFTPAPVTNNTPATPTVQPFRNFRYEGFSQAMNSTRLLASISEGGNTYEVSEGACVMGQYCVTRVTESLVEIEDLILKRRQTFTRVQ
jgi:hypothetical protein